jgi:hypothetical protein
MKRGATLALLLVSLAHRLSAQELAAASQSARAVPLAPVLASASTPGAAAALELPAAPALAGAPAALSAAAASAAAPASGGWDDARALARRLAEARGVPPENHLYFYEMLARYIYNSGDDAALAALARRSGPLQPSDVESLRWQGKLERDLHHPYDDAAALARLDHLQAELEDFVRWLDARAPRGSYRILVMGGLLRGRLSAHSDVDLMLETDDAALLDAALASPFGYLTKARDAVVGPVPRNPSLRASMGEIVDIGDGRAAVGDGFLRALFFRARAAVAAAPMSRDVPPDEAEMAQIKRLGRRLDETRDAVERARLEARIDVLAAALPPMPAPAAPGRDVPVGASVVDLSAPGAFAVLRGLGAAPGRPTIGLYHRTRGVVLNAAPLGVHGVTGHESLLPARARRDLLVGWTAELRPDGTMLYAGSGAVPGELTSRLRREVRRYLGVRPARETRLARLARLALALRDRVEAFLGALGEQSRDL